MTYCIFVCFFLFFILLTNVHIWSKVDWWTTLNKMGCLDVCIKYTTHLQTSMAKTGHAWHTYLKEELTAR